MTCPRCQTHNTSMIHEAKDKNVSLWKIIHCETCSFTWRDTEADAIINPAKRNRFFQLSEKQMAAAPVHIGPPN